MSQACHPIRNACEQAGRASTWRKPRRGSRCRGAAGGGAVIGGMSRRNRREPIRTYGVLISDMTSMPGREREVICTSVRPASARRSEQGSCVEQAPHVGVPGRRAPTRNDSRKGRGARSLLGGGCGMHPEPGVLASRLEMSVGGSAPSWRASSFWTVAEKRSRCRPERRTSRAGGFRRMRAWVRLKRVTCRCGPKQGWRTNLAIGYFGSRICQVP